MLSDCLPASKSAMVLSKSHSSSLDELGRAACWGPSGEAALCATALARGTALPSALIRGILAGFAAGGL